MSYKAGEVFGKLDHAALLRAKLKVLYFTLTVMTSTGEF